MERKCISAIALLLILACGPSANSSSENDGVLREATDTPDFTAVFEENPGENDCRSQLIDPVDNTELILVSSRDGIGNYQVPLGKYDVDADELLRINCRTGKVIGVIKR